MSLHAQVVGPELGRFVNMQRLFLGANRIASLDGIQPLSNLVVLSLQSNKLTNCDGLQGLRMLKELCERRTQPRSTLFFCSLDPTE